MSNNGASHDLIIERAKDSVSGISGLERKAQLVADLLWALDDKVEQILMSSIAEDFDIATEPFSERIVAGGPPRIRFDLNDEGEAVVPEGHEHAGQKCLSCQQTIQDWERRIVELTTVRKSRDDLDARVEHYLQVIRDQVQKEAENPTPATAPTPVPLG